MANKNAGEQNSLEIGKEVHEAVISLTETINAGEWIEEEER